MDYKDLDDYYERLGMNVNPESAAKRFHVWTELGGLGQLLNRGLIDIDFIPTNIQGIVIRQWEKWEPLIMERRERVEGMENRDVYFEYLYNEVVKYRKEHPEITV